MAEPLSDEELAELRGKVGPGVGAVDRLFATIAARDARIAELERSLEHICRAGSMTRAQIASLDNAVDKSLRGHIRCTEERLQRMLGQVRSRYFKADMQYVEETLESILRGDDTHIDAHTPEHD